MTFISKPTLVNGPWRTMGEIQEELNKKSTMKKIFQYAVIVHKFNKTDNGQEYIDSEMIVQPSYVLAKNEKEVVFKVTRLIPEEHATNPDNVEIVVRNF